MIRAAAGWAVLIVVAATAGALAIDSPTLLLGAAGASVLVLLLATPTWAAVLAVALLPFQVDVVPGIGVNVGAADLLMVVAVTGWALQGLLVPSDQTATSVPELGSRSVRPLAMGLLFYSGAVVLTMVMNPSTVGVVTALQRAELVVAGLLVGGGLVRTGRLGAALEGYYLSTTLVALAAGLAGGGDGVLGIQKNPAGGFVATGLILVLALRPGRRWMAYAPVMALGLVATQSRGALIGIIVAAAVTLVVVRYGERGKMLALYGVAGVLFVVAYLNLSDVARGRLLNVSGTGEFAVSTREAFQADAFDAFRSSPWWGVGVGNYNGGVRYPGINDPHQVLYLTLAEGGAILLVAFVAFCLVTLWAAFRALKVTKLAVGALAVQVSTLTHAMVDIYWVRGTPVPAYVLLGATLAVVAYAGRGDGRVDEWVRSGRGEDQDTELVGAGSVRAL